MAEADRIPDDAWRLDDQSGDRADHQLRLAPPPTTATATNLSHQRLTRPVYVVTAEHLAWYLIAAYALLTRAIALGARPLDSTQATDALAAFLIAGHGRAAFALSDASWVTILQGWIFATAGATDASARIVVMLCGLLLVAIGFVMRPILGRAGSLAFAALIAISPSVTYFARGGSTAIASIAFMMIAIAIAESMRRRPTVLRAAGLGTVIAMWITADPIGYVTAAAIAVSLILAGLADAVRLDHRRLRLRVWWHRRRALVIVCAIVAIGLWLILTTAFFHRPLVAELEYSVRTAFARPPVGFRLGVRKLIPILAAYEFLIAVLAIVGAFAIVSRRIGDRFAAWSLVWAIATLAVFFSIGSNSPNAVVALVLPLVVIAAFAIDWMHRSDRWPSIRYAIAVGVALTLYVHLATNFVYPAPDTSEAPWRRHALLFWSEPTTSIQTVRECDRVRNSVSPNGASAMVPDDAPQIEWYLRDFSPTDLAASANIVVTLGKAQPGALAGNPDTPEFGFEESWTPDFHSLTVARALLYFFTQRAWSDVEIRDFEIATPKPAKPVP